MTAVIYARYSSDNQREGSIEGQIRECTAYAERNTDRHLWRSDRSCIRGKWFGFGLHSCTKKTRAHLCSGFFFFIRCEKGLEQHDPAAASSRSMQGTTVLRSLR